MTTLADPRPAPPQPRPDPHPVDPRRPRGAADPMSPWPGIPHPDQDPSPWGPRESFGAELRAVVADAWRGTSTHATTAALRATRAGRLALGTVRAGALCIRIGLLYAASRAERQSLVDEARARDLFRRWPR